METRKIVIAIITAVVMIGLLITGISYAEIKIGERKEMARMEEALEYLSQKTGWISLGTVDAYEISKKSGLMYDGPGILKELFERRGMSVPENHWIFRYDFGGVTLNKMVVYKGPMTEPIWEQDVEVTYIYGTI